MRTWDNITYYASAITTAIGALSLSDWGVVIGMATAVITSASGFIFKLRQDRREMRLLRAKLQGDIDATKTL